MAYFVGIFLALFGAVVSATLNPRFLPRDVIMTAVTTPFYANGSINFGLVPAQARYLSSTGSFAVFVSGTTGESVDLSVVERRALASAWAEVGPQHNITVVIHVGADSIEDSKALAAHAASLAPRVSAIGWMPPTFIRPATPVAVAATAASVAAAAPDLPFLYYHIPSMTGVTLFPPAMAAALDAAVPTFAGVKYTDYDLQAFRQMRLMWPSPYATDAPVATQSSGSHFPAKYFLFGRDEELLAAAVFGADGAVGSTYNWDAETAVAILREYRAGRLDTAMSYMDQKVASVYLMTRFASSAAAQGLDSGHVSAIDSVKLFQGIATSGNVDPGAGRLPYLAATSAEASALRSSIGTWCLGLRNSGATVPSWCRCC
eukprot:TRINITY_DN2291_c0_g2_i1.p1 TRINITY_DN2291_c0_g2~~TRINITY_DN2291_c0_g2_i1.p1  ORF type:complete len:389 (+),score=66.98 TRINITY_DN2291_c0_g2_i1:46-1167(+)